MFAKHNAPPHIVGNQPRRCFLAQHAAVITRDHRVAKALGAGGLQDQLGQRHGFARATVQILLQAFVGLAGALLRAHLGVRARFRGCDHDDVVQRATVVLRVRHNVFLAAFAHAVLIEDDDALAPAVAGETLHDLSRCQPVAGLFAVWSDKRDRVRADGRVGNGRQRRRRGLHDTVGRALGRSGGAVGHFQTRVDGGCLCKAGVAGVSRAACIAACREHRDNAGRKGSGGAERAGDLIRVVHHYSVLFNIARGPGSTASGGRSDAGAALLAVAACAKSSPLDRLPEGDPATCSRASPWGRSCAGVRSGIRNQLRPDADPG